MSVSCGGVGGTVLASSRGGDAQAAQIETSAKPSRRRMADLRDLLCKVKPDPARVYRKRLTASLKKTTWMAEDTPRFQDWPLQFSSFESDFEFKGYPFVHANVNGP
jgi:hypothetical protein